MTLLQKDVIDLITSSGMSLSTADTTKSTLATDVAQTYADKASIVRLYDEMLQHSRCLSAFSSF